MTREGLIDVGGARLSYRLSGAPSDLPALVFENGWGASYHQWAWLERELAAHTQLLFYSRAGIGGSEMDAPQTLEGLSRNLTALLDALQLTQPVVVVGHSYGGLVGAVHAGLIPQRLRALVQVDPTPEISDAVIDASLKSVRIAAGLLIALATLRLPDPLFSPATATLPPEASSSLCRTSFRSAPSLRASRAELGLLDGMRSAAAQALTVPRLVISAGRTTEVKGPLLRLLAPEAKARALVERMQNLHRSQAQRGIGSRWESLPHDHGGLVFTEAGGRDTAARILAFLKALPARLPN